MLNGLQKITSNIKVGIVGRGWFGINLYNHLSNINKIEPSLLSKNDLSYKKYDVIYECTGDPLQGALVAKRSIDQCVDFITINSEMDCLVGLELSLYAKSKAVMYTNSDGDQPGVLAKLLDQLKLQNFKIKVAGNCKGFLDKHADINSVSSFVSPGQNPYKIVSFADGTKQAQELCVVANSYDLNVYKRGMNGYRVSKKDILKSYKHLNGCVDYSLKSIQNGFGSSVFVIGFRDDIEDDMRYLKMGDGPDYIFFKDYHLCYLEAINTILEVVLYKLPTLVQSVRKCEVISYNKKNGMYGLIDNIKNINGELPASLYKYCKVVNKGEIDTPIFMDDVKLEKNLLTELREL